MNQWALPQIWQKLVPMTQMAIVAGCQAREVFLALHIYAAIKFSCVTKTTIVLSEFGRYWSFWYLNIRPVWDRISN